MKSFQRAFLLFFVCLSFALGAQTTVSGTVTQAGTGEPLIGATVRVKGTTKGTATDLSGKYSIEMPSGATTLVFSYAGSVSQEVLVRGGTVDVQLSDGYEVGEIVVIGSRNQTRTKLETPVAVDVIPIQNVVNEVGQIDVNQILTYVAPSFQSSRQAIADGTDHVDPAQLRGLGPDQVLVLVNGKRRHQSALVNVNGTVNRGTVGTDLNAIPASSIERIEILRDGAAAQYGSDAIAAVINIVTKSSTGKLDVNVSGGQYMTEYAKNYAYNTINNIKEDPNVSVTDGQTIAVGANYGFKLGTKGFLNLTGEFSKRGATNRSGLFTGRLYPNVSGQNRDDSIMGAKRITRDFFDMRIGNSEVQSYGVVLNSAYKVSNTWELYLFGGYNKKQGNAAGFYRYPTGIPAASNALSIYPDGFLPNIDSDVSDMSGALGIRGSLGGWSTDLSQTYGSNSFDFGVSNSVNYTQSSLNAASAQKEFDAGGLKFQQLTTNLDLSRNFDVKSGLNVAFGAEFRIDGFEIKAGEEASWKNYNTAASVASGAQVFAGFQPTNANGLQNRSAAAGYLDLELDLTENLLVGGALRFENYSDFGSTLNYKAVSRWKLMENVTLRGAISTGFRAPSQQQKYYAKTNTLFVNGPNGLQPVESGTFTNDSELAKIFGIPELKQETSQNYSAGVTLRPAKGLEVTLDAYQINIDDRIVLTQNFGAGGNADLKAKLDAAGASSANFFSNSIDTRSRGIEAVVNYTTRFSGGQELRLVFATTYIDNEVVKGSDGKAAIKASDILVSTGQVGNYFNREDQSRIEVANPRSKASLAINYKTGKLGIMLRNAYWGKVGYLDPIDISDKKTWPSTFTDASFRNAFTGNNESFDQEFSPKLVTDLTLNYQLLKQLNIALGANNLFDVYQDRHTHSNNMSSGRFVYSRRVQQMGFNGRFVFARLRFTL